MLLDAPPRLFLCSECQDIVGLLQDDIRYCECSSACGHFDATGSVHCEGSAIPIELDAASLGRAIATRIATCIGGEDDAPVLFTGRIMDFIPEDDDKSEGSEDDYADDWRSFDEFPEAD